MSEKFSLRPYQPGTHTLRRDRHGRLVFTDEAGVEHEAVVPVRAFPIEAPDEGISLVSGDGHELIWIARLAQLEEPMRALITEALSLRDFNPVIAQLVAVSSFATPSTWTVFTDRGRTDFVLKGEEDIRRLRDGGLLITDSHGVTYRVADLVRLDRASRRLLDRFL